MKSPIFFSVVRWLEGGFAVIRLSFTEEHIHTLQNLCWFHIRRSVFLRVLSPRDTHTLLLSSITKSISADGLIYSIGQNLKL